MLRGAKFYILFDAYILRYTSYAVYDNSAYPKRSDILFDSNQLSSQFVIIVSAFQLLYAIFIYFASHYVAAIKRRQSKVDIVHVIFTRRNTSIQTSRL